MTKQIDAYTMMKTTMLMIEALRGTADQATVRALINQLCYWEAKAAHGCGIKRQTF